MNVGHLERKLLQQEHALVAARRQLQEQVLKEANQAEGAAELTRRVGELDQQLLLEAGRRQEAERSTKLLRSQAEALQARLRALQQFIKENSLDQAEALREDCKLLKEEKDSLLQQQDLQAGVIQDLTHRLEVLAGQEKVYQQLLEQGMLAKQRISRELEEQHTRGQSASQDYWELEANKLRQANQQSQSTIAQLEEKLQKAVESHERTEAALRQQVEQLRAQCLKASAAPEQLEGAYYDLQMKYSLLKQKSKANEFEVRYAEKRRANRDKALQLLRSQLETAVARTVHFEERYIESLSSKKCVEQQLEQAQAELAQLSKWRDSLKAGLELIAEKLGLYASSDQVVVDPQLFDSLLAAAELSRVLASHSSPEEGQTSSLTICNLRQEVNQLKCRLVEQTLEAQECPKPGPGSQPYFSEVIRQRDEFASECERTRRQSVILKQDNRRLLANVEELQSTIEVYGKVLAEKNQKIGELLSSMERVFKEYQTLKSKMSESLFEKEKLVAEIGNLRKYSSLMERVAESKETNRAQVIAEYEREKQLKAGLASQLVLLKQELSQVKHQRLETLRQSAPAAPSAAPQFHQIEQQFQQLQAQILSLREQLLQAQRQGRQQERAVEKVKEIQIQQEEGELREQYSKEMRKIENSLVEKEGQLFKLVKSCESLTKKLERLVPECEAKKKELEDQLRDNEECRRRAREEIRKDMEKETAEIKELVEGERLYKALLQFRQVAAELAELRDQGPSNAAEEEKGEQKQEEEGKEEGMEEGNEQWQ